jgi:hypothetical protein
VGGGKGLTQKDELPSSVNDPKKKVAPSGQMPQLPQQQQSGTPQNPRSQAQAQGTKQSQKSLTQSTKGKPMGKSGHGEESSDDDSSDELDYEDIVNTRVTGNNLKGNRKSSGHAEDKGDNDDDGFDGDIKRGKEYNAGKYAALEVKSTIQKGSQLQSSQIQQTPTKTGGKAQAGKGVTKQPVGYSSNKKSDTSSPKYNFNDDIAWNSATKTDNDNNFVSNNQYGSSKRDEKNGSPYDNKSESEGSDEYYGEAAQGVAPRSNIVEKYFNKKKGPTKPSQQGVVKAGEPPKLTSQQEEEIVKRYVNDKIEVLNTEISKFKLENERVKKVRRKYEDMMKELNQKTEEFQKKKEQEMQELEEWKEGEKRKIKNEKKLAERQSKALANVPNRKEREEIENLKKQVTKLTDEIKIKEQRNKLTVERMRKQIDDLTLRNAEYQQEIKHYEQMRLAKDATPSLQKSVPEISSTNSQAKAQLPKVNNNYVSPRGQVVEPKKNRRKDSSSEEEDDSEKENKQGHGRNDYDEEEEEEDDHRYEQEAKDNQRLKNFGRGYSTGRHSILIN